MNKVLTVNLNRNEEAKHMGLQLRDPRPETMQGDLIRQEGWKTTCPCGKPMFHHSLCATLGAT